MSSLEKKERKKKKKKKELSPSLTLLHDDLLLSCFARVSRLYYPTLSFVSKRFRSLLASPELYKVRSLLGHTESCLYVCMTPLRSPSCWFTLCRKPNLTLTNKDTIKSKDKTSSGYVLAKVPIHYYPPAKVSGLVAVGSSIYNIDGSSGVLILDCKSHTWCRAPSFPLDLNLLSACVFDRKIYVAGYIDKIGSVKNTFQVLDTETLIWDHIPFPPRLTRNIDFCNSAFIDGKFHVTYGREGEVIAYDSKEGKWDLIGQSMGNYIYSEYSHCTIDNVLYSAYPDGELVWYDTEMRHWKYLKGLVGLVPKWPHHHDTVRLADFCGKMMVLWDEYFSWSKKKIRLAEIKLDKRSENGEIWGKVEWSDHVLTVSNNCNVIKVLAVTV